MARTLILTSGPSHPFEDSAPALAAILGAAGIEAEIETDVARGIETWSRDASFGLLTVYALRWRMLGEGYAAQRAVWASSLSDTARRAVSEGIGGGRPLLGLHTASICFDDWPGWREVLGGAWVWGTSFHPPFGPATVEIADVPHPITAGLDDFSLADEIYSAQGLTRDVVPLAHARAQESQESAPVLWARRFGNGRVVYDALGHDRASLEHAQHRRILVRAALWALGRPDAEVAQA